MTSQAQPPVPETYPHTYKRQREYERDARKARENQQAQGLTLPPVCGFTYKPRKPKNPNLPFDASPVSCPRTAGMGTTHEGHGYCNYHEVQAHKETAKGRKGMTRDVQEAKKVAYANANFFGERTPTDPHMALMDEISRTSGIIKWIENHMVAMRDEEGLTEDQVLTQFTKQNGWVPGVWMELYKSEREHLVRTCTAAIKAGVAERRVQIAEQQGQLIVAMMMSFIHDPALGLSAEQVQLAPGIIRKHMLDLPRETPTDPRQILEAHATEV